MTDPAADPTGVAPALAPLLRPPPPLAVAPRLSAHRSVVATIARRGLSSFDHIWGFVRAWDLRTTSFLLALPSLRGVAGERRGGYAPADMPLAYAAAGASGGREPTPTDTGRAWPPAWWTRQQEAIRGGSAARGLPGAAPPSSPGAPLQRQVATAPASVGPPTPAAAVPVAPAVARETPAPLAHHGSLDARAVLASDPISRVEMHAPDPSDVLEPLVEPALELVDSAPRVGLVEPALELVHSAPTGGLAEPTPELVDSAPTGGLVEPAREIARADPTPAVEAESGAVALPIDASDRPASDPLAPEP
jgi:hypothetical protein